MPPVVAAIGAAIAGALGTSVATGIFIANLAIGIGTSLAIGAISRALTPRAKVGKLLDSPAGRLVSARQAAADRRIVYGRQRVGGILSFLNATGTDNEWLQVVLTLTGCQISEFEKLYLDGEEVPLSGFEEVEVFDQETGDSLGTQLRSLAFGRYEGYLYMESNLGTDDQPAFPSLVHDSLGLWTVDHRQRGCAGAYLRFRKNENLFPQGLPQITFDIKGKPVYDPRTATTVYSNNAALACADYMTTPKLRGGFGADYATEIDEAVLIAAANICDEPIDLPPDTDGNPRTEPRYTIDGMFDFSEKPGEIIEKMCQAMSGNMIYIGGKFAILPGAYRLPSLALTDDDFIAPLDYHSKRSIRDLFNTVKGSFVSEDRGWQETDFPMVQGASYLATDGEPLVKDVFLPFTISQFAAQRLASIDLERNRRQGTLQATCNMRAYALQPGDVVRVTHSRFGWDLKTFEAADCTLAVIEGKNAGPVLAIRLTLQESDVDVYGFAVDDYGETILPGDVNLPRVVTVPPPPYWSLTADLAGNLTLDLAVLEDAHYVEGDLFLLFDDELNRIWTALDNGTPLDPDATTMIVASSEGFLVDDLITVGEEIMQIIGPGVGGAVPTSLTWEIARNLYGTRAEFNVEIGADSMVRRLQGRDLIFPMAETSRASWMLRGFHVPPWLPPLGLEISIPGVFVGPLYRTNLRPGRMCILAASLTMRSQGGKSLPLEASFAKYGAYEPPIQGTLPGMRVGVGGLEIIDIPGELHVGTAVGPVRTLPEGSTVSVVCATLEEAPTGGDVIIEVKIDGAQWTVWWFREDAQPFGPATGRIPAGNTLASGNDGGLAVYQGLGAFVSGAQGPVAGRRELSVEVLQVGSVSPGRSLRVYIYH